MILYINMTFGLFLKITELKIYEGKIFLEAEQLNKKIFEIKEEVPVHMIETW